jgi:adenylate cyclase
MNEAELQNINIWLMNGARSGPTPAGFYKQTCERLVAAGIPLSQGNAFVQTLHPDVLGRSFTWQPGTEVAVTEVTFDAPDSAEFKSSPLAILLASGHEVRYRLGDPESRRVAFFDGLRAGGLTDYIAIPLLFTDGTVHATSWFTKAEGGFTDDHLAGLRFVTPALTRVAEIHAMRRTAAALLDTYVGNSAGERILAGDIRRGHSEAMRAAIWLSDLRGFTSLSDRLPAEIVVDILNRYFDCQVPAIRAHGGEILKFMGDGLLAVFPIAKDGGDLGEVCGRVLEASREARALVDAMHYPGGDVVEQFRFGLALHVGDILFGNIGGVNRLDFTCIGPSVNLAARLEKVASSLHRTVVASAAFAGVSRHHWLDLGEFSVAGFSKAQRVFGLRDEGASSG